MTGNKIMIEDYGMNTQLISRDKKMILRIAHPDDGKLDPNLTELTELVYRRIHYAKAEKDMEAAKKAIDEQLISHLESLGTTTNELSNVVIDAIEIPMVDGGIHKEDGVGKVWRIREAHGMTAAKIVAEKLLTRGVPMEIIQECTEPGKETSHYIRIDEVKAE